MLQPRTETVLKSIIRQYISRAVPVSSTSVVDDCDLDVSSATIRNEMVALEGDGYIIRPHHAAGSIPSDKGYRYYVSTLSDIELPVAEQRLINHLFHQVEERLDEWLGLAVTLLAQRVQNVAVVTMPKPPACRLKHLELVSLQDYLALVVLVLYGAVLRQQLVNIEQPVSQTELTAIASRLGDAYSGLSGSQIVAKEIKLSTAEQRITDCLLKMMEAEDERPYEEPYLDGLHYLMNQPEFKTSQRMVGLVGLVEQRKLVEVMVPDELGSCGVQVVIGKENKAEVIQDYSVVISRYGLPDEAVGTISVVGPTRMPYARAISTIGYMAEMMSRLVAELYGRELPEDGKKFSDN
jgi:heat-inducible transcriptional repressor